MNSFQKTIAAAGSIGSKVRDYSSYIYQQGRPVGELVDLSNFSRPENTNEAVGRIQKNYRYFRINYAIIICMFVAVAMILNPSSLIVLGAIMLSWIYVFVVRAKPMTLGGRQYGEREQLIAMSLITVIIVFFATSVGSYIVYSLLAGAACTAVHAAFRSPEDLFVDNNDHSQQSLFSFFSNPQSQQVAFAV